MLEHKLQQDQQSKTWACPEASEHAAWISFDGALAFSRPGKFKESCGVCFELETSPESSSSSCLSSTKLPQLPHNPDINSSYSCEPVKLQRIPRSSPHRGVECLGSASPSGLADERTVPSWFQGAAGKPKCGQSAAPLRHLSLLTSREPTENPATNRLHELLLPSASLHFILRCSFFLFPFFPSNRVILEQFHPVAHHTI